MSGRPLVIAHRGASGTCPENTRRAYALAVAQRADMIEIDLHRARDGAIVIAHDAALERLGGRGEIAEATLSELRGLDAGEGERVPTLDEVLDEFGASVPFNLELKGDARDQPYPGLEAAALDAVAARGLLPRMLFSSFFDPILERLRALSSEARIGLLLSPRHPQRAFERARKLGAEAIHPHRSLATPELLAEAHATGLAVHVFTANDEAELRRLVDLGIDGIFTDYPDRLRALLPGARA